MSESASRYDYQFDPQGDGTAARVCRLAGQGGGRVLELGCAAGAMSAVLAGHYGCTVTGVEYEAPAAEQARRYCERVVQANLDDAAWADALEPQRFDTIVAADVLEHLRDPLACLRRARALLAENGRLVVSVPNIAHGGVLAALLANDFSYRETGLLDRTHIHFFTSLTLGRMLVQAGFQVDGCETVDTGPWHPEFSDYWGKLPDTVRDWLAANPAGQAYQVVMLARPAEQPADYVDAAQAAQPDWLAALPGNGDDAVQLAALREALQAQAAELAAARAECEQARSQLAAITSSSSWRLTAGLRRLANALKSRP